MGKLLLLLLLKFLKDWGLTNKILCITTDNGADIVKGMRLLRCKLMRENRIILTEGFHVRCIAHVINLAIKEAFKDIHVEVASIRKLIGALKSSVKQRDAFHEFKIL